VCNISTAKKSILQQNIESYSPKEKPVILRIAEEVSNKTKHTYSINFNENEPDSFETNRLLIRHFRDSDCKDLQQIAISKEFSEFADFDHEWPADEKSIKSITEYFAAKKQFWAVEVKNLSSVVCMVNFNGMNAEKQMDIGNVMNGEYFDNDYEYEALGVLYDYCFKYLNPEEIIAHWVVADKKKIEPLKKLGMTMLNTGLTDAFKANAKGEKRQTEGCKMIITRKEWEAYR